MNDRVYTGDYAWTSRNFVQAFVYVFDTRFYDVRKNRYLLDEYLADGRKRFGGYDSLLLWHSYTNIGVDSQNQFQMLRSLPGGLPELKKLIDRGHQQGVKTYIAYNPWDRATAQEKRPAYRKPGQHGEGNRSRRHLPRRDREHPARKTAGRRRSRSPGRRLGAGRQRSAVRRRQCDASMPRGGRGIPRLRLAITSAACPSKNGREPRHMIHFDGDRWRHDRTAMFQHAFLNGDRRGDLGQHFRQLEPLHRARPSHAPPHGSHRAAFQPTCWPSEGWEPFYPTLAKNVDASYWPGADRALWTIVNWSTAAGLGRNPSRGTCARHAVFRRLERRGNRAGGP